MTITGPRGTATIRKNEHREYAVHFRLAGTRFVEAVYYTDCRDDARFTARDMVGVEPLKTPTEHCRNPKRA